MVARSSFSLNLKKFNSAIHIIFFFLSIPSSILNANEFDRGSSEFDQPTPPLYTDAEIQRKIAQEMKIGCQGNMCEITGMDSAGAVFTVSLNVGYGTQPGYGGAFGYGGSSSPGVIIVGQPGGYTTQPSYMAGIMISYKNYHCQSHVLVTPAVYRFINTYLYNSVNPDGSVKRQLTPADQIAEMFYATLLTKVGECKPPL